MQIHYYNILPPSGPNYGDELNRYVWNKTLTQEFSDVYPMGRFYGIGSVLRRGMRPAPQHVVFGAGLCYDGTPTLRDGETWDWRFVRGPQSGSKLGVRHITDPGILMALWHKKQDVKYPVSIMPRHTTEFDPKQLAEQGYHLIRPQNSVESVTEEIAQSGLLITEALHGAVVANALRVPFVSIRTDPVHDFKWHDWCQSLDMVWNPIDMDTFTLNWARDNAIPQLSSWKVLNSKLDEVEEAVQRLNEEIIERDGFFSNAERYDLSYQEGGENFDDGGFKACE